MKRMRIECGKGYIDFVAMIFSLHGLRVTPTTKYNVACVCCHHHYIKLLPKYWHPTPCEAKQRKKDNNLIKFERSTTTFHR